MKTVFAIGVGPGRKDWLTMAALEALEKCTFVAGYKLYLDGIKELLTGKKVVAGVMGQEIERCRAVLDAALNGETAAIISSGDAGNCANCRSIMRLMWRLFPVLPLRLLLRR